MLEQRKIFFSDFEQLAVDDLLATWKQAFPTGGAFVFVAEASREQLPLLQHTCKQADIPLIGAVFPALIHGSTFLKEGFLFIRMNEMPEYFLTDNIHTDEAVDQLSMQISMRTDTSLHQSLFLMFDAMVPTIATILDRLYLKLADSVQYSGVNAGSETFQPMPCLFNTEVIMQNAVLAILMPASGTSIVTHGYPIPTEIMNATSSTGNCIQSIDWQPAFEAYKKLTNECYGVEISAENFYEVAVHFPFGIVLANGETLIRIPVALSEDGALFCVGEVPENSILTLMHGKKEVLLDAVKELGQQLAKMNFQGLTFYCAGRRMHLGLEQATVELATIAAQHNEVIGALSLGEIGISKASAYPQFHNAALVCSPCL